jgi:hypothetical protein
MTMSDSAAGPDVSDGEEQRPGYDIRFLDDAGMQKLGYQIAYWKYGRAYL